MTTGDAVSGAARRGAASVRGEGSRACLVASDGAVGTGGADTNAGAAVATAGATLGAGGAVTNAGGAMATIGVGIGAGAGTTRIGAGVAATTAKAEMIGPGRDVTTIGREGTCAGCAAGGAVIWAGAIDTAAGFAVTGAGALTNAGTAATAGFAATEAGGLTVDGTAIGGGAVPRARVTAASRKIEGSGVVR